VEGSIRWSYAMNAWKPGFMGFARIEEHERALKVTSACGFRAIELRAGTGRWEPLGRPDNIEASYGTLQGFRAKLRDWGIDAVSSTFFDPGQMSFEDLHFGMDPLDPKQTDAIVAAARLHARGLAALGGEILVVRPVGSYWKTGSLSAEQLTGVGDCWSRVGAATQAHGVRVALHVDTLSALRTADEIETVLDAIDPAVGGLAIDTAELTVAGHDLVALYERLHARVVHFQFKDALERDTLEEFRTQNAERALLQAGGSRHVGRWFAEMGTSRGLVDFPALVNAMLKHRYQGWVVVESDGGPAPIAAGVMSNGWYVGHVLAPILARAATDERVQRTMR
jgi:inosose dehydratase